MDLSDLVDALIDPGREPAVPQLKRGPRTCRRERRRGVATALLLASLVVVSGCDAPQTMLSPAQDLTLTHVTIVDPRSGALAAERTILVRAGRITAIVSAAGSPDDAPQPRIDGGGRFVIPGLLDLHSHALQSDPEHGLALMLAHGITGYRQMAGSPALLERRRRGEIPAGSDVPELLAMPGLPLLDAIAASPADAVREVQEQHAQGADFIKVASLEPATFFAALDEAKRLGLPFEGHLPFGVSARDAAKAGMRAIEHLGPTIGLLLSCSTEESALREIVARAPPFGPPKLPRWLAKLALPLLQTIGERFIVNPVLHAEAWQLELVRRVLASYSREKCVQLAGELARHAIWQTPTLIRIRTTQLADDPAWADDPALRFVSRDERERWSSLAKRFHDELSPENRETLRRLSERLQELVLLFDRAGVPMLAGTDAGGAQWIVPGASLHREIDLLEQAGLSPLRILQMTTSNAATFLGRERSMGGVEAGQNADLVLLDRDPTQSAQALHAVHAVVRAGRHHSREALDAMLARASGR